MTTHADAGLQHFVRSVYEHAPRIKKGHKVPENLGEYIGDVVLVMEPSGIVYDMLVLVATHPKVWESSRNPPKWRIQD